ncbi:MAG: transposase [Candidatus Pacebacteria bacterium]|nr:transposase [Candidatus Paceibacterota bacterium]
MAQRIVPFVLDEYYHIYNRGNSKQIIYKNDCDYERFMQLLYLSNGTKSFKVRELGKQNPYEVDMGESVVAIGAYCLMPNHFHILLKPLVEGGISIFMKKLSTGYSMYFNKKYKRTGSLFEGKFKSKHVSSDTYLKYLFSYIHLNPVKLLQLDWREKGINDLQTAISYLEKYKYSSYIDQIPTGLSCGERSESAIINTSPFPDYSEELKGGITDIIEWLEYEEEN